MKDIDIKELKEKMDKEDDFILIDVREPYEHEEFNVGGELIPVGRFPAAIEKLEDKKEEEIVIYCRSGRRSGHIKKLLEEAGFQKVRNLEGGMLAWIQEFNDEED